MLLGTFISRPQQIHTEPGPPSLGHVPACITHNKLSLSENFYFFFPGCFLLLHSVNKGTAVTIQTHSFLFAWEPSQLFVGFCCCFCSLFSQGPLKQLLVPAGSTFCCCRICHLLPPAQGGDSDEDKELLREGTRSNQRSQLSFLSPPNNMRTGCSVFLVVVRVCLSFPSSQGTVLRCAPR